MSVSYYTHQFHEIFRNSPEITQNETTSTQSNQILSLTFKWSMELIIFRFLEVTFFHELRAFQD